MIEPISVEKFICCLQKCRKTGDLAYARLVHAGICCNGMETHRCLGNHIVPMFVECGSLPDAQQVFNNLVRRNEHSWSSLILGYIECGQSQDALRLYQEMQEDSVYPTSFTLVSLLKACAVLKDLERGRAIQVEVTLRGFERDLVVGNTLVSMYSKCGIFSEAQAMFDRLPVRDVVSWNALTSGYMEYGIGEEALNCFEQMQLEDVKPNAVMIGYLLKACGSIGVINNGREIHLGITRKGYERYPLYGNILVDTYVKFGSLSEAREVFDHLSDRDVVSWTTLIAGYAEHGRGQEALKCFEHMQLEGILPNVVTFACALKGCGRIGAIENGRQIHSEIILREFERNLMLGSTLVSLYAKCGFLAEAQDVFVKLQICDTVSWNALAAGFAEHGSDQQLLKCFEQMKLEGVSPSVVTLVWALKACGSMGAIDKVRQIHQEIPKEELESYPLVGNTLIDMYAKCNSLSEARKVFDKLPVRDVASWNALIAGYAQHGPAQEALKCLEQMQVEGVYPDAVTFVCVLKACGSLVDLNKGREIQAEITLKGFERDLFVGNALVDMYSKCGSPSEACAVFSMLPVKDIVSWNTLIAGYAEGGPGQDALKCFEQMHLEHVYPNAVTFSCILKVCGSIGAINEGRELHMRITANRFEGYSVVGNALVDMYEKCGLLSEAQEVFDKMPVQDVVSWNTMIAGYAINHEEELALQCFEDMQQQDVKPNAVTFICLLTACSHGSLLFKGQKYFKLMKEKYDIAPTLYHYTCMIDLLARSGYLYEAEKFLATTPCPLSEIPWRALLTSCKTYGEAEIGLRCFWHLTQMNSEHASSYVLMAGIYASAGGWDDAHRIEELRKHAGAKKKSANALIEVNKKVHAFVVGNNESNEISVMLEALISRMKGEGHMPNVDLVLRSISKKEKKEASYQL